MQSRWRNRAKPIIAGVIKAVGRDDQTALRAALVAAYPFGVRANHPYKIWCSEVRRQLGLETRGKKLVQTDLVGDQKRLF